MELFDIAPREAWQALLDGVRERTGMTATCYNAAGEVVIRHEAWANALCPRIQENTEARTTVCAVAQQVLGKQAMATGEPQVDECDVGMIKFAVPIVVGGDVVGTIGACGGRDPDVEVETFLAAQLLDTTEEALAEDAAGVPTVAEAKVTEAVAYLQAELAKL